MYHWLCLYFYLCLALLKFKMLGLCPVGFTTSRILERYLTLDSFLHYIHHLTNILCHIMCIRHLLYMVAITKNIVWLSQNWFFVSLLNNGLYIFNIIQFSLFLQDGSSPELPSLERKNKRRKIKGKKGIVQNILAERNCSYSNYSLFTTWQSIACGYQTLITHLLLFFIFLLSCLRA